MGENDLEQKPKWEIYNESALAPQTKPKIQPLASVKILRSYIKYKLFQSLTGFRKQNKIGQPLLPPRQ